VDRFTASISLSIFLPLNSIFRGSSAAVVFYGTSPRSQVIERIKAPVVGLYGGNDQRIDATTPPAAQEMKRLGKSFEYEMFPEAGPAFMRAQDGQAGANLRAAQQAWPRASSFLKKNLNSGVSRVSTVDVEIGLLQTTRGGHL
jgi:dienelactone hydrolase